MKVQLVRPLRPDGRDERSSLCEGRIYTVLAIECDWYRILNAYGEPTLHDPDAFEIVDGTEPNFWVSEPVDRCRYAGPPELLVRGFFERWHDGDQNAIASFRNAIYRYYPDSELDLDPQRSRSQR